MKKPQSTREIAARALCRKAGNSENTLFEGKPMWMSYLDTVDIVLGAIGEPVAWGVMDMDGEALHSVHIFKEYAESASFGLGYAAPLVWAPT